MVIEGRGVSLARDEKKEEENPGSDDRDLRSPEGYAARYVLRHPQVPDREDAPTGLLRRQDLWPATPTADGETPCPATTVRYAWQHGQSAKIPISGAALGTAEGT
jgi:hypothetical protein